MVQYFRLIGLALLLSVSFGNVGQAQSNNSVSNTFNRLAEVDIFGDDIAANGIKGISLAECEEICSSDNLCKAYSFIADKHWCFPKNGLGELQPNINVFSGIKKFLLNSFDETNGIQIKDNSGSCEDGASNMAEIYDCLHRNNTSSLTDVLDELSNRLLLAGLSDNLQFLQSSQNAWTENTDLYCLTLHNIAVKKWGLYAGDIQSNCVANLFQSRSEDLHLLLNALVDDNYAFWTLD